MAKQREDIYEELLVLRAQQNDAEALMELVQRWHGRLLLHAVHLTRDADGAEEAMQESWLAIVRGIEKLHNPAAFRLWAYRIVGRHCANWVKQRQRIRRQGNENGLLNVPAKSGTQNVTDTLENALAQLSVEHREVLTLHYLEEMTVEEIASALDLKSGTIKSRLHYAREVLKRFTETPHD